MCDVTSPKNESFCRFQTRSSTTLQSSSSSSTSMSSASSPRSNISSDQEPHRQRVRALVRSGILESILRTTGTTKTVPSNHRYNKNSSFAPQVPQQKFLCTTGTTTKVPSNHRYYDNRSFPPQVPQQWRVTSPL